MNINYDSPFNFKPIPTITPMSDYWQNSTWKFNMSEISAGATYQPSWIDIILHGVTALTLVNAKAGSLEYLKLFGDTEQLPETYLDTVTLSGGCEPNGTPTPTQPIDIISNNGVVKVSPNLFNKNDLYLNHYISSDGTIREASTWDISAKIPVVPNTNYTLSGVIQVYAGISHAFFNSSNEPVSIIPAAVGTTVLTAPANASYLRLSIRKESGDKNTVQLEQGSTATTYMPYGQIYTQGTVETVTDSNGLTASAEMLLAVGTYKDTQEVLSGNVTRNIGIKVFDGSENFDTSNATFTYAVSDRVASKTPLICSHFEYSTKTSLQVEDLKIISFSSTNIGFRYDACADTTAFKAWLKSQYDNGTPVIIVYPLATTTSEAVAGQFLSKSPVTQTAGAISNLPIAITESQKTVPTPQQPLPINCNNGVLGIDSQGNITITGTTETVEITGKNLLDMANANIHNGYINTSVGVTIGWATSAVTNTIVDAINVKVGETYTFSSFNNISGNLLLCIVNNDIVLQKIEYPITANQRASASITATANGQLYIQYVIAGQDFQLEQGSTATTYEPYFNGGSALAENLLKVGTYQDVQDVTSGNVTRNVGIKVLNGTENWTASSFTAGKFFISTAVSDWNAIARDATGYCTHAVFNSSSSSGNGRVNFDLNSFCFYYSTSSTTLTAFKQYLADQYNAGTPVIVVYPLATPTTETATAQPMNIQAGTNIVQITQASMDDLELEVKYKAGVSVTITEIQNAQLDDNVEVTIQ